MIDIHKQMFYNVGKEFSGGSSMNIYKTCPEVSNERFRLRLVTQEDCVDLLEVYSDAKAVPLFNGDNCNGDDFHYATLDRMQQAMSFWIWSYENGWFVRMSIVDLSTECAVGTIELCYRDSEDTGVLRLDLRSDYETEADIADILSLIVEPSYGWIGCSRLITKARPIAAERIKALSAFGFTSANAPLIGHDGTEYGDYFERMKR